MKRYRTFFISTVFLASLALSAGSAWAVKPADSPGEPANPTSVSIADFTAYPPFLPRIVSPNILFLLDYSENMLRPAYGICNESLSPCRRSFLNVGNGGLFDANREYEGYFRSITNSLVGSLGDVKYAWSSSGGKFEIDSSGDWTGNWLNWLTMTQFDISKKVAAGGSVNPAPEGNNTANTLEAKSGDGTQFLQIVDETSCKANAPDTFCDTSVAQVIPYRWINTPASSDDYETILTGTTGSKNGVIGTTELPFDFTLAGQSFAAGSTISVNENGWATFYTTSVTSRPTNSALPTVGLFDYTLAPYWDALVMVNGKNSNVHSFTVGETPRRLFVITFENLSYDLSPYNTLFTFQIVLVEGTDQVIFQYQEVGDDDPVNGSGSTATVGVQGDADAADPGTKQFSVDTASLSDEMAILMTPGYKALAARTNNSSGTQFYSFERYNEAPGSTGDEFVVKIDINSSDPDSDGNCPPGHRINKTGGNNNKGKCFDHPTEGLLHVFFESEDLGDLAFRLGIMLVDDDDGGVVLKHFNERGETGGGGSGWPAVWNALRGNAGLPTDASPLAEALYEAQGYIRQDTDFELVNNHWTNTNDPTSAECSATGNEYDPFCFQSYQQKVPCANTFVLMVSSGNYTQDNNTYIFLPDGTVPSPDPDADTWANWAEGWRIAPDETSGSEGSRRKGGWLDNIAYQLHAPDYSDDTLDGDLRFDVGLDGGQIATVYTVDTYGHDYGLGGEVMKRAAILGGFLDADGDNTYDIGEENLINPDDPSPDTYFPGYEPGGVRGAILNAVTQILKNSASGTSVSVLSTSAGGEGALYQAYFYPSKLIEGTQADRKWPGYMRGFFLDRSGNLRDDHSEDDPLSTNSDPNARLEVAKDRVAMMNLNESSGEVTVDVFGHTTYNTATTVPSSHLNVSMDDVPTMWEASERLAQRAKSSRKIYLWLDDPSGPDGIVDDGDFSSLGGEALEFSTTYNSTLAPYLRASDYVYNSVTYKTAVQEADEIIQFIQGLEVGDYRSRCQTVDNPDSSLDGCADSSDRSWPLGDIVFSTPTLVALPSEKYHQIYSDADYGQFFADYHNRRQMIYVGANDGMLHAINAGVYTEGDISSTSTVESGYFVANPSGENGESFGFTSSDPAQLGDEMWAFLPQDNLPLISYLGCNGTDGDPLVCGTSEYTHIYYVDHRPKATDVQIFNHTGVTTLIDGQAGVEHTKGWGTIIIVPMRLGGGAIDVDLNDDGDTADPGETSFRSAYYCFDVTDPEKPPKLLWRFTHADLGFTTSYPGIARIKNSTTDEWYMVVGSGPANTTGARDYFFEDTTSTGKVFVVDLKDGSLKKTFTLAANHIMGDPTMIDVDLDFSVDVIYIGANIGDTVGSNPYQMTAGRVYRINTNNTEPASSGSNWTLSTLFDPDQGSFDVDPDNDEDMGALLVGPSAALDSQRNLWVFFGSGRLRNKNDLVRSDQQRFYGIRDKCWKSTSSSDGCNTTSSEDYAYELDDLVNSSAIRITNETGTAGQVIDSTEDVCNDGADGTCSFADLLTAVRAQDGWYVNLINPSDGPSELVAARSSILGGIVLFTTYIPSGDICSIFGDSNLYALFYETGTAYIKPIVGTHTETIGSETKTILNTKADLGKGMPTSVGLAVGDNIMGFVQKSTGAIERIEQEPGLNIRSGLTGWREDTSGGGTVEIETIYRHVLK